MIVPIQRVAHVASSTVGRDSWIIRQLRPAYEFALQVMSGARGLPWEINGVTFRVDPQYRNRLGHDYDAPVARFLSQRIKPGAICFDVGANVGVYALQFAQWTGPAGKVIAFEPNPLAAEVLSTHLRMNGFHRFVTVEQVAIGACGGTVTLHRSGVDGMSRLGEPNSDLPLTEPVSVPMTTIDDFCARTGLAPNWMLIDIEGFEFAALRGAARTIEQQCGRLGLVVEIHPGLAETTRADAERFLSEMGLRAVPLGGQRDPLGEHGQVYLSWC